MKQKISSFKYIGFYDEESFNKALKFMEKESLYHQVMGYGVLEVGKENIKFIKRKLKNLEIGVWNDTSGSDKDKKLMDYWNNLVEEEFGYSDNSQMHNLS